MLGTLVGDKVYKVERLQWNGKRGGMVNATKGDARPCCMFYYGTGLGCEYAREGVREVVG